MSGVLSTGNFYKGDNFYQYRCVCNDGETTLYSNSNNPPLCNGCPTVSVSTRSRARAFRYRNAAGDEKNTTLSGGIFSTARYIAIVGILALGAYLLTKKTK
jgi:hypothetical protein